MVSKLERAKAEVKLLELEEKFVAAKADGKATPALKAKVRAARQDYRDNYREGGPGTVQPDTVTTVGGAQ